jgi:hypothetical protein
VDFTARILPSTRTLVGANREAPLIAGRLIVAGQGTIEGVLGSRRGRWLTGRQAVIEQKVLS